jgi:hypothetical protein
LSLMPSASARVTGVKVIFTIGGVVRFVNVNSNVVSPHGY